MIGKKVFLVRVPVAGIISKYIVAANEKDAIEIAVTDCGYFEDIKTTDGWELEELDVYEKLVEGNINNTNLLEAEAEESDEFDPEDLDD